MKLALVFGLTLVCGIARADDNVCLIRETRLEDLKVELREATAAREAWVKEHCKLVHNGGNRPGRHWRCDGKFAGNEGDIIQSPEELRLQTRIYDVSAWLRACCHGNPPNYCKN